MWKQNFGLASMRWSGFLNAGLERALALAAGLVEAEQALQVDVGRRRRDAQAGEPRDDLLRARIFLRARRGTAAGRSGGGSACRRIRSRCTDPVTVKASKCGWPTCRACRWSCG